VRRDPGILIATRASRALGFGFSAILVGVYLQARGLSPTQIGIVIAVGLAAASASGLLVAELSGHIGRRLTLAATGLLMAMCGFGFAFGSGLAMMTAFSLSGMLGSAGTDVGPFLSVEQSILAETTEPKDRNRAFARYSMSGGLAASAGGALAALGTSVSSQQRFFALYGILGLLTAALPLLLTQEVEREPEAHVLTKVRPLLGLSALLAIDSLGGGLIVRSVLTYWLHLRFGATPVILGPAFGGMSLLGTLSFEAAGRLANRIGLINTMVFTHVPVNALVIALPFMPNLGLALLVLFIWSAVGSMDVPARQSYVVSIVAPNERSGALAITGAIRGGAQSIGPLISGIAIQSAASGLPFVLAGIIRLAYGSALYLAYRNRFASHESLGRGNSASLATPHKEDENDEGSS
jgi:MFS family permease